MGIKKGGACLLVLLLLIWLNLLVPEVSRAANDTYLSINQVESKLPDVTLYVRIDNSDADSVKLKAKDLNIKINNTRAQITDIQSVKNKNGVCENTAYLVLVDKSWQNTNQLSELQILLEKLQDLGGPSDKTAVFSVSNELETIKDFLVNDSAQNVSHMIGNALSSSSGARAYLYSGIREAYDMGRKKPDIPNRRIIILITDGSAEGDCLSSDDIIKYMDVDRLPVYTLILGNQSSIPEEFKNAAEQIAQKTGGQSFISVSGNELFSQFKTSIEKCSIIKLRCDRFKAYNLQAIVNVDWQGSEGEIRQTAKFTAAPAPKENEQLNQEASNRDLRTSYFGVAVILIPMVLFLIILLSSTWFYLSKSKVHESIETNPASEKTNLQNSEEFSGISCLESADQNSQIDLTLGSEVKQDQ